MKRIRATQNYKKKPKLTPQQIVNLTEFLVRLVLNRFVASSKRDIALSIQCKAR